MARKEKGHFSLGSRGADTVRSSRIISDPLTTPKQVESLHLIGVKAFLLLGIEEGWKQAFMSAVLAWPVGQP